MSVQVKRRREAAAFLQTFVGAQGELLVDTTNNRVQVHDGATPGGFPAARFKVPTQTILTTASGTAGSGTYAPPSGASWLRVRMVAGGGGGAGSGASAGNGAAGGVTSFGALSCNGGNGATGTTRGTSSGVPTGGDINFSGNGGLDAVTGVAGMVFPGGAGGASCFAGGGAGAANQAGKPPPANSGAGGGGGGGTGAMAAGGGGASGAFLEKILVAASYAYAVGAGGTAGAAGTSGFTGAAGSGGLIVVEEHYD